MFGTREARRAALYRQLGVLETAGIPLGTAIHKVVDPTASRAGEALDRGEDPGTAWRDAGFSPLEVALVKAGAKGGMLAGAFKDLEEIFEERASAARKLVVAVAYPVILLHLAVLIPALVVGFQKGALAYAKETLVPIGIAWAVFLGGIALLREARRAAPSAVDPILGALPMIGGIAKRGSVARAIRVLGALYKAGVPVRDAVDAARDAATLHETRKAFERVGQRLDQGLALGDAFLQEEALPVEVREAASTGSLTGQLDVTLAGAEHRISQEAKTRLGLLLVVVPIFAFLLVALRIAMIVIGFWSGYAKQMDDLMK